MGTPSAPITPPAGCSPCTPCYALSHKEMEQFYLVKKLCGSCTAVCPVKIDLDAQLFRWRQHVVERGYVSAAKKAAMKSSVKLFDHPRLFRVAGSLARLGLRILPAPLARIAGGPWARARELPAPPKQSFRAWYRRNRPGGAR